MYFVKHLTNWFKSKLLILNLQLLTVDPMRFVMITMVCSFLRASGLRGLPNNPHLLLEKVHSISL